MPITVANLFETAGLKEKHDVRWGSVNWGEPCAETGPGVYAVCLLGDGSRHSEAPLSVEKIGKWLDAVPKMQLSGHNGPRRPSATAISEFLNSFWLPDESILYIGQSKSLSLRFDELFNHKLGCRSRHRGGHWLHALSDPDSQLRVHFVACDGYEEGALEKKKADLLARFSGQVSRDKTGKRNSGAVIPFANLVGPQGRKQNRLSNQVPSR